MICESVWVLFLSFWRRVYVISDWSWTHYVSKDKIKIATCLSPLYNSRITLCNPGSLNDTSSSPLFAPILGGSFGTSRSVSALALLWRPGNPAGQPRRLLQAALQVIFTRETGPLLPYTFPLELASPGCTPKSLDLDPVQVVSLFLFVGWLSKRELTVYGKGGAEWLPATRGAMSLLSLQTSVASETPQEMMRKELSTGFAGVPRLCVCNV